MRRVTTVIVCLVLASVTLPAITGLEERIDRLSKEEMQAALEFLSHDLLEGRAAGQRGGQLAEVYARSLFKFMNLAPGYNGDYWQPIKLKSFTIEDIKLNANDVELHYREDIVGSFTQEQEKFELEADAVYVGFGITAPLWDWDDFKGVDVRDKIIITRVNDPGLFRGDNFEGETLTYFGRWIYHVEEAIRRGAAGILLIHTDMTAGYSWEVVKNSWPGEEVFLESEIKNNLKFRGWIKESSLQKLLLKKRFDLDKMYRASLKTRFRPINLGFKIKVSGQTRFKDVFINNVVAEIPGKSPKKIVLSAHIDHLGMSGNGPDRILNGALDNASAVSAMMLAGKILKEHQDELYYTVVLLACNAEEAAMLGSRYYVQQADRANIIANINFESTPVWEKARSVMAIGGRFSTLEDMLKSIARKEGLDYSHSSLVKQGFFFRSDQFSFARYNIPAIWISAGEDDESGKRKYPRFWATTYHTVKDEYDPTWPLEGLKQTIRLALLLVDHINTTRDEPKWKADLTFPLEK